MKHENILPLLGLWSGFNHDVKYPIPIAPWLQEGNLSSYLHDNSGMGMTRRLSFVSNCKDRQPILTYFPDEGRC